MDSITFVAAAFIVVAVVVFGSAALLIASKAVFFRQNLKGVRICCFYCDDDDV